jgi:hypothetical protein
MSLRSTLPPLMSAAMRSPDGTRSGTKSAAPAPVDFDAPMQAHLSRVFGKRDSGRRLVALKEFYTEDASLFEPHVAVTGQAAISVAVDALQASMPPQFVFTAAGPAVGHNGEAHLQWRAGPPDGPAAVTGTDVAHVENGQTKTLHVFPDPRSERRSAP